MELMDTNSEEAEEMRLPYARRPEWADVSPIFVDDGNCVVAVQYLDDHREALSYFRAVVDSGEKSPRVLELTMEMIGFNQADYTAWQLRWLCVETLDSDLEQEYRLTEDTMKNNAKNYQLWNHRRKVALKAGPATLCRELEFVQRALDIDEKNYHAWAHRLAVVEAFDAWDGELVFVERMVERDVRNNSAWNHRFFVVRALVAAAAASAMARPGGADAFLEASTQDAAQLAAEQEGVRASALKAALGRELAYIKSELARAPRNESPWNYLLGLFSLPGCRPSEMAAWPIVHEICLDSLAAVPSCPPALAALAEYYFVVAEATGRYVMALKTGQLVPAAGTCKHDQLQCALVTLHNAVGKAASLLDGLTLADPIRTMFWMHRNSVLQQLLLQVAPDAPLGAPAAG